MHDAGFSLERIGDYVGHSSAWMTDRYRHLLAGHDAEAAERFEPYLSGRPLYRQPRKANGPPLEGRPDMRREPCGEQVSRAPAVRLRKRPALPVVGIIGHSRPRPIPR
jgi:hypothetical protein